MNSTKKTFLTSLMALLLCVVMLMGTTFAWFTDVVTSTGNIIQAGNLDAEMYYSETLENPDWKNADGPAVFNYEKWEPGYTSVRYIKVKNAGKLNFKFQLSLDANGVVSKLGDVIDVYFFNPATEEITTLEGLTKVDNLTNVIKNHNNMPGTLAPGAEVILAIALHMQESAGNEYQKLELCEGGFDLKLIATQVGGESDSFGPDYDDGATWEDTLPEQSTASSAMELNEDGTLPNALTFANDDGTISITVPAGTKFKQGTKLANLNVNKLATSGANITLEENEETRSFDVHVANLDESNTEVISIAIKEFLPAGLNMGNYQLYHVEDGQTVEMKLLADGKTPVHNSFNYDPATGDVVLHLASFSEVALVADTVNAWEGKFDYSWYNASKTDLTIANADQLAAFGAIVGGMNGQTQDSFKNKTVKLISDINLGDKESENNPDIIFYPIGYYNSKLSYEKESGGAFTSSVHSFEGIFDGNGNTIANFYQNTWEMFGDYNDGYSGTPNHYKDAMGLFGYVYGGTVKNLTVDNFSSDGEFTPTGVIAAYAAGNAVFENIAITKCNPRVYNTGNGGIIGIAGSTSANNDDHITLKNITVDNSNKISALWGSWDVACGGLVGMYRGNVDGNGNATGDTISFENCHVAAQIDVYNDVCANYQYYAYRYSGMIIGSVRHNTKNAEGKTIPNMAGISASGCTVNYGDWNDYYYCEFEKNTMASYSEDYQFSRVPHSELNFTDSNGNGVVDADERNSVTGCKHTHTAEENHRAVYLPFHQLFTGYSWGVSSIGLKEYSGIVTDPGITEGEQQESVKKFESKFTGDFLYRVGNQNTVSLGSLFGAVPKLDENGEKQYDENGKLICWDIKDAGVWVKVEKLDEKMNVGGTFTANTIDWTKGKIKFSGTGVVKVTIQDYNFCKPTELLLEVVDAKNYPSPDSGASLNATANNVVLLNDISSGFTVSGEYGFYGNGFTIELNSNSHSLKKGNGYAGYIHMNGGVLDNVVIVGPVFAESNIYQSQGLAETPGNSETTVNYFRNAICIDGGDSKITNSYISGARTAILVKAGGDVVIENSRISGGAYANIEVLSSKSLTLKNVITEQKATLDSYGKNKEVIGIGIVINNADTKLILDGLTQYNWMNQTQWDTMLGDEYKNQFPKLFTDSSYSKLWYTDKNNTRIVNAGIIWACDVETPNREGSISGYEQTSISLGGKSGKVYTTTHNGTSSQLNDNIISAPDYTPTTQGAVPPKATFDYTGKNNEPEQSGSNDYCYYNTNEQIFVISFDQGESKKWHYDILTVQKGNVTIPYDVAVSGSAVVNETDKTITFSAPGDYIVTYTYTDSLNHTNDLTNYSVIYTKKICITVYVVEPEADPTTFEFGLDGYKLVTAGGVTYVMPNVTATKEPTKSSSNVVTASGIGSKTIDGQTIYYPIIGMHKVGNAMSYYNYFSIFEAVTIKDANGAVTYNTNTTSVPSNLTVIGGFINNGTESANGTAIFNYSTGKTIKTKSVTVNNKDLGLCYYPDSSFSSQTSARDEQTIVVKYCYTDSNGKAYYYYIGYWCAQGKNGLESSGGCFAEGTLITLADGTQKPIEEITYEDQLLAWDFNTGAYAVTVPSLIESHEAGEYRVINLKFADGTVTRVIVDHGFFDVEANNFVYIDEENVESYIGHNFVKVSENGTYESVELIGYEVTVETVSYYTIQTAIYNNCIAENMFTLTSPPEMLKNDGWFDYFEIGEDMKYDGEKMQADIEKYGLYTYEDFAEYVTYEQFIAFNGPYLKVLVGRGVVTYEQIIELISMYISQ